MTPAPDLAAEVRAAAEKAQKVAPGEWECDHERQTDAPDRHYEYALLDGRGHRMCGTENCDGAFGEIHGEHDSEDGFYYAWNEPSQVVIDYFVKAQPKRVLALLDENDALRARIDALEADLVSYQHDDRHYVPKDRLDAAEASRDALAEQVKRLTEALEPFSRYIDQVETLWPDHEDEIEIGECPTDSDMITLGDLRRARTLLTPAAEKV